MTVQEARRLLEAELSHNEIHDALRSALKERHPNAWLWLADVYDDHVIYKVEPESGEDDPPEPTRFYKVAYVVAGDGAVTLGDSAEVERVISYEPVAQPQQEGRTPRLGRIIPVTGDLAPVREAKGPSRQVLLISPGWGSSGYWPAEVLERDGPAAFPAGTHQYIDHPTESELHERPERSIKDLAATLAGDAQWLPNGPEGPGLYAETVLSETWAPLIDAVAEDIGISVSTWAESVMGEAEGKRGPVIKRIAAASEAPLNSVDFVTKAGRGGKLMPLLESARRNSGSPTPGAAPQHEGASVTATSVPKEADEMDEKQLQEQLEAAKREASELREANEALTTENGRLRESVAVHEARTVVTEKLSAAELPEITKQRLRESLVKGASLAEDGTLAPAFAEAVEAAIADEVEYVAKLTESGKVRDQGGSFSQPDALHESFKSRYLAEGMSEEQAERMAAVACGR